MYDFTQTSAIYHFPVHCFYSCVVIAVIQLTFRFFMTSDTIQNDDTILLEVIFCITPQELYTLFCFFVWWWFDGDCMMTSSNGNIRVTGPLWGVIHRSPVESPHKGQWRGALMFSSIRAWSKGRSSKQSRHQWYKTPSPLLWRQCNVISFLFYWVISRMYNYGAITHWFCPSSCGTSLKAMDGKSYQSSGKKLSQSLRITAHKIWRNDKFWAWPKSEHSGSF